MPRFTIRDLLWWTMFVALVCASFVHSPHIMTGVQKLCDIAWQPFDGARPPLTARRSLPGAE